MLRLSLANALSPFGLSIFSSLLAINLSIFISAASAQVPTSPNSVMASDGTSTELIEITWNSDTPTDELQGFLLYRSTTNSFCPGAPIATIDAALRSFEDTTVIPNTVYYYSLRSFNADGESNCSDTDSGFADVNDPPLAPSSVAASEDLETEVLITWVEPDSGPEITNYQIFRSTSQTFCSGDPLTNISVGNSLYSDLSAVRGQVYYYSLRSQGPTGTSNCSNIDRGLRLEPPPPLPPVIEFATDGEFEDKVNVGWDMPGGGEPVTSFRLFRSTSPGLCSNLLQAGIPFSQRTFEDTNVIPGLLYYYSVQAEGPTGISNCSALNSGFARVSEPNPVSATDGIFPDKIDVTFTPPENTENITSYDIFRDTAEAPCTTRVGSVSSAGELLYEDRDVTRGIIYYYSVKSVSSLGSSDCSVIDGGFAVTQCTDSIDNDGDGLLDINDPGCQNDPSNDSEDNPSGPACDNGIDDDGDGFIDFQVGGAGDPGCSDLADDDETDSDGDDGLPDPDEPLQSPASTKFNTFLGQRNYVELINQGEQEKIVQVKIYNLFGELMIQEDRSVPAKSQLDVDINNMVQRACDIINVSSCTEFEDLSATESQPNGLGFPDGVVDTYGLVVLEFNDSDPNEQLLGRVSFYRPNPDGSSFSFAFARQFLNPSYGTTYAMSNTYDPQGLGFFVPNWAEVINFTTSTKNFSLNIFNQSGELVDSQSFSLPAFGERDIQAGHEFLDANGTPIEGVYLVEVIAEDPLSPYLFSVSRYSSNDTSSVTPETYQFAFSLEGSTGFTEDLFAPVSSAISGVEGLVDAKFVSNWIEIANVDEESAAVTVFVKDSEGTIVGEQPISLAPKAQFHIQASALLKFADSGSVEIRSNRKVIAQSMSYVHGEGNETETGFASQARQRGRTSQAGSINTFLQMQDVLISFATTTDPVSVAFEVNPFDRETISGSFDLNSSGAAALELSNNETLSIPSETYGAVIINTPARRAGSGRN